VILKLTLVDLVILSGAKAWRVWIESPANTSKKLDKYVVVRVILHGQCSLQRKEAI
jgi:hypothetical protein